MSLKRIRARSELHPLPRQPQFWTATGLTLLFIRTKVAVTSGTTSLRAEARGRGAARPDTCAVRMTDNDEQARGE